MTRPESGVRYVMVIDAEPRSERSSDERLKRRSRNKSIRELEKKIPAQNAEISGRPAQPVRYDKNERGEDEDLARAMAGMTFRKKRVRFA
jgi:hypothetical protein